MTKACDSGNPVRSTFCHKWKFSEFAEAQLFLAAILLSLSCCIRQFNLLAPIDLSTIWQSRTQASLNCCCAGMRWPRAVIGVVTHWCCHWESPRQSQELCAIDLSAVKMHMPKIRYMMAYDVLMIHNPCMPCWQHTFFSVYLTLHHNVSRCVINGICKQQQTFFFTLLKADFKAIGVLASERVFPLQHLVVEDGWLQ